jgi:WD40 repeat protein
VAVVNYDNTLSVFSVTADGSLTQLSGSPIGTGHGAQAVAFDPAGPFVAVINSADNSVSVYEIGGGQIASVGSFTTTSGAHGTNPAALAFSPGGNFLATADSDGYVSLLDFPSGAMHTGYPIATGVTPTSMAWNLDGTLAIAGGYSHKVSLFAVKQDGTWLGALSTPTVDTGTGGYASSVSFSRDGSLLAAADRNNNSVFVWHTNTFTAANGSPTSLGATSPDAVAFSPGSDLLAVGSTDSSVRVYEIGGAGALTPVDGSPFKFAEPTPVPSVAFGRNGGLLAIVKENVNQLAILKVGAPRVTIDQPDFQASFYPGQSVAAAFTCRDPGAAPGLASCTGSVPAGAPLDTSTTGAHTFSVTAVSRDGQTTTQTVSYTVEPSHASLGINPKLSGTTNHPVPVSLNLDWHGATIAGSSVFQIDLPVGIVANVGRFPGCSQSDALIGSRNCASSVLGTGRLLIRNPRSPASDCESNLALVLLGDRPNSAEVTIQPLPSSPGTPLSGCPSPQQRLGGPPPPPFFGTEANLTTVTLGGKHHVRISFTLPPELVGATHPPHNEPLLTPHSMSWTFPLPRPAGPGSVPHPNPAAFVSTSCPRGGWPLRITNGTAVATDSVQCQQPRTNKTVAKLQSKLGTLKTAKGAGKTVSGVVVHTIPHANTFVLSNSRGSLFAIHSPNTLPTIGSKVTTGVKPLKDGSWLQTCMTTLAGGGKSATLKGVVTFVSEKHHAFVLSVDGASMMIRHVLHGSLPQVLHTVTVNTAFKNGSLLERKLIEGGAFHGKLTLVGLLKGLRQGAKGKPGTLTLTADDNGSLQKSSFDIPVNGLKSVSGAGGLNAETEVILDAGRGGNVTTKKLPGKTTGQEITLTRGLGGSDATLYEWRQQFLASAGLQCKSK